jgi:hypothetical protein
VATALSAEATTSRAVVTQLHPGEPSVVTTANGIVIKAWATAGVTTVPTVATITAGTGAEGVGTGGIGGITVRAIGTRLPA